MQRNLQTFAVTSAVISPLFPAAKTFLDFGGGHGTFVRLMRDRGFNFFWQDLYAKNIHARTFEYQVGARYDLVTAFELMEHLPDPVEGMAQVFALSERADDHLLSARPATRAAQLVALRGPRRPACLLLYPPPCSSSPGSMIAMSPPATASTCSPASP